MGFLASYLFLSAGPDNIAEISQQMHEPESSHMWQTGSKLEPEYYISVRGKYQEYISRNVILTIRRLRGYF